MARNRCPHKHKPHLVKVNYQVSMHMCQHNMERPYAFFLVLKAFYSSGRIFNARSRYGDFGGRFSKRTFVRYINIIVDQGWASWHGDDLQLVAYNALPKLTQIKRTRIDKNTKVETRKIINVPNKNEWFENNKKLDFYTIRAMIVGWSEFVQRKAIKHSKEECQKLIAKKLSSGEINFVSEDPSKVPALSCQTTAGLMNRSQATGHRTLARLESRKLITMTRRYLFDPDAAQYKWINGNRWQKISNAIQATFDRLIRGRVVLSMLPPEERAVMLYCNDCFG